MGKGNHLVELYIDGASRGNPGPAGIGVVFTLPGGRELHTIMRYIGTATNNVAEYIALITGLEEALRRGYPCLRIYTDSQLLERQIKGLYSVKSPSIREYFHKAMELLRRLRWYDIIYIKRGKNVKADALANRAIDRGLKHPA